MEVDHLGRALAAHPAWEGREVLVTAGPTREAIDPVRFITNASSGRLGLSVVGELARRGARVELLETGIDVDIELDKPGSRVHIITACRLKGATGVEMEALTAVSVAALTLYDMCKSHDREMIITAIQLREKAGGKSGHYVRPSA